MTALSTLPLLPVAALLVLSVLACLFAVPPLERSDGVEARDDLADAEAMRLRELMIG